jgi:hypothetical protein
MPRFGPYDYFAIEWGYKPLGESITSDEEWPLLDAMAARQIDEPLLRFGGEDAVARLDPSVTSNVLGSDLVAAGELGLENVDRVMPFLLSATTPLGKDYTRLAEMYYALVNHRYRILTAVARLVGGVEEIRYHGGRGGLPFRPVAPERQRQAVRFLIDRAFVTPKALLDREVMGRIEQASADDALQGINVRLLQQLLTPGVFSRMAEASAGRRGKQGYYGLDLLEDLNQGLFSELTQDKPIVDSYRRQLQRNYGPRVPGAGDHPQPVRRSRAAGMGRRGSAGARPPGTPGRVRQLLAGRYRHAVPGRGGAAQRHARRGELGARRHRPKDRRRHAQGRGTGDLGAPARSAARSRPRALSLRAGREPDSARSRGIAHTGSVISATNRPDIRL